MGAVAGYLAAGQRLARAAFSHPLRGCTGLPVEVIGPVPSSNGARASRIELSSISSLLGCDPWKAVRRKRILSQRHKRGTAAGRHSDVQPSCSNELRLVI